jgi:hypothetical protein
MTNLFVTQKQAVDLKELGFTETCFAGYEIIENGELFIGNIDGREQFNREFYIPAPTKQQVFKWSWVYFHLSHNIFDWLDDFESTITEWNLCEDRLTYEFPNRFDTYEQAESACIDKLIEIIKTK